MKSAIPLVSVITPAYNSAKYMKQAINSVQQQTFQNWEMIIVDDGSHDNTCEIVKNLMVNDTRIRLIATKQNRGVADARNRALLEAKGRFIAFLDSDDYWMPTKLAKQLNFMTEKSIGFSFCGYRQISMDGTLCGLQVNVPESITYSDLLKKNIIGCLTVMLDRQIVGEFSMRKERHEDYILWLSLLKSGHKAYGLNEDLARYRIVSNSITSNKLKSAIWVWLVYRKSEHLNYFLSLFYFINYLWYSLRKSFRYGFLLE
jgi:teichuronic acid biosynthesis glycosyltransferase TuaG